MENTKKNPDAALLQEIYKSVSMGTDASLTLLGKTDEGSLKRELSAQIESYQGFAKRARAGLAALSVEPKEAGMLEKLPAEMSMMFSTLTDTSAPKIAELMINGAVMGVTEYKKLIRNADEAGASIEHIRLAGDILSFHEEIINKMRIYL